MKSELQKKAKAIGQQRAREYIKRIDPVFTPRRLDPDDAKVIFHPVDFVVFHDISHKDEVSKIVFLDGLEVKDKNIQKSFEELIERRAYEWQTLRVMDDGEVKEE